MTQRFTAWNGPSPTTAAQLAVTTGTVIKTMLQVATPATREFTIIEWGISFPGSVAAAAIECELIETDVAATVTAHVAAGVVNISRAGGPASLATLGTAATGYTASAEGTITASRVFDAQWVPPTSGYQKLWPMGREPVQAISKFLRVRVTAAAAQNALTWITWEE